MQPLGEVFGFPTDNDSARAQRYRANRLCPYNNRVANCTKDKANDPLGVCSIQDSAGNLAITCPIRFRHDWLVAEHAASFFFPHGTAWTSLSEVRLNDREGISAGNIDIVLVSYDERGRILDFGSLEVQAVYISGNVRNIFEQYMNDHEAYAAIDWSKGQNRPRPDYLSSSRKRLVPQLLYKGAILKHWGKKQAVALHSAFFATLPKMEQVAREDADIAWLIYDLIRNEETNEYQLELKNTVYTLFESALLHITTPAIGDMSDFLETLQEKLDVILDNPNHPPDAPTLNELM